MTKSERNPKPGNPFYCRRRREESLIGSVGDSRVGKLRTFARSCYTDVASAHVSWLICEHSSCKKIRDSLRRLLQELASSFGFDSSFVIRHSSFYLPLLPQ